MDLTSTVLVLKYLWLPLLTLKVIGSIHFEAFRLWREGVRLIPRPHHPQTPGPRSSAPGFRRDVEHPDAS